MRGMRLLKTKYPGNIVTLIGGRYNCADVLRGTLGITGGFGRLQNMGRCSDKRDCKLLSLSRKL
jgi:hypothetical protein